MLPGRGGHLRGAACLVRRRTCRRSPPTRCHSSLTSCATPTWQVSPNHGTMNRRTGEPISVVVRFTPQQVKDGAVATLVFETEDMRNIYKFIAST